MPKRIDTDAVRRDHPIEAVAVGYGIALRRSGRALVGRCPLHDDRRHPNLHLYPAADPARDSWFCYRCNVGGDAIELVARVERVPFLDAVARLCAGRPPVAARRSPPPRRPSPVPRRGPAELACVAAAADFYAGRLAREPAALDYLASRGMDVPTSAAHRIGYASGEGLADHLRWRGLPLAAARRAGLLRRDGSEHLAGRVVVPELRGGRAVWLIGRAVGDGGEPKYLGLPGAKPLLGWENARASRVAFAVEGVFGYLALRRWGYPALGLLGTRVRPAVVAALSRFERLFLVMDDDEAGRAAADSLVAALAPRATRLVVPGVVDVDELAPRPDGRLRFARAADRLALPAAA